MTVAVDAVVYYRISNATIAVSNVEDYGHSTRLLAATTLRNVLGTKNLSEILSERESISHIMQVRKHRRRYYSKHVRHAYARHALAYQSQLVRGLRVLITLHGLQEVVTLIDAAWSSVEHDA